MQQHHETVLRALHALTTPNGERCVPFISLQEKAGLDRAMVRRCCRYLARQGLAEFYKALWSDDGEPRGAGYCISARGITTLEQPATAGRAS